MEGIGPESRYCALLAWYAEEQTCFHFGESSLAREKITCRDEVTMPVWGIRVSVKSLELQKEMYKFHEGNTMTHDDTAVCVRCSWMIG